MPTLTLKEKQILIDHHEKTTARRLAVMVIDKPVPPIWMIFVPVFFVFFASKMKQYSKGLEEFADNYLISRRWALETAAVAVENATTADIEAVLKRAASIPETARPLYRAWIELLTEHYRMLLSAEGNNHPALVRAAYHSKSGYLLFCDRLGKAENALNHALLPAFDTHHDDIKDVIEKMSSATKEIRSEDLSIIFS